MAKVFTKTGDVYYSSGCKMPQDERQKNLTAK